MVLGFSLGAQAAPQKPDYCKTDAIKAAAAHANISLSDRDFKDYDHATTDSGVDFKVTWMNLRPEALGMFIQVAVAVPGGQSWQYSNLFDLQDCRSYPQK